MFKSMLHLCVSSKNQKQLHLGIVLLTNVEEDCFAVGKKISIFISDSRKLIHIERVVVINAFRFS